MSVTINEEEYLTAGESARYLKVSSQTFTNFIKKYKLQSMKRPGLGQRKFFRKKDLEQFLEFRPNTPE
jgi:excisionase family DNA binding protein